MDEEIVRKNLENLKRYMYSELNLLKVRVAGNSPRKRKDADGTGEFTPDATKHKRVKHQQAYGKKFYRASSVRSYKRN